MVEIWRYISQVIGTHGGNVFQFREGAFPLDIQEWHLYALLLGAILIVTSLHEFGHAWAADKLGDPTPRKDGRVSPWPWAHVDALGLGLFLVSSLTGLPFGWGKPLHTDPRQYRIGVRWGTALVAIAGPLVNLLTAILLAPLARYILRGGFGEGEFALWSLLIVAILMLVSLSLFCFNLVPVYPLDMTHVVASLLPESLAKPFRNFMRHYGSYVLIGLMLTNVLNKLITPLVLALFRFLIGL